VSAFIDTDVCKRAWILSHLITKGAFGFGCQTDRRFPFILLFVFFKNNEYLLAGWVDENWMAKYQC
jgi:hypothetical protein